MEAVARRVFAPLDFVCEPFLDQEVLYYCVSQVDYCNEFFLELSLKSTQKLQLTYHAASIPQYGCTEIHPCNITTIELPDNFHVYWMMLAFTFKALHHSWSKYLYDHLVQIESPFGERAYQGFRC